MISYGIFPFLSDLLHLVWQLCLPTPCVSTYYYPVSLFLYLRLFVPLYFSAVPGPLFSHTCLTPLCKSFPLLMLLLTFLTALHLYIFLPLSSPSLLPLCPSVTPLLCYTPFLPTLGHPRWWCFLPALSPFALAVNNFPLLSQSPWCSEGYGSTFYPLPNCVKGLIIAATLLPVDLEPLSLCHYPIPGHLAFLT